MADKAEAGPSSSTPKANAKLSSTPESSPGTRKVKSIFGLGKGINDDDSQITGSRLPTCRQVLRCMMYHLQNGSSTNQTKWECAKTVLLKVRPFYGKANIPMITERKACEKIIQLVDGNNKLRSIPVKRRTSPAIIAKLEQANTELDNTFQLWPANVEKLIKNHEDLQFLISMKTDRAASFGPCDNVLAQRIQRSEERSRRELRRRKKHDELERASSSFQSLSSDSETDKDTSDVSATESASDDTAKSSPCVDTATSSPCVDTSATTSSSTPNRHRRLFQTGTEAFIPYNILQSPKLVSIATRMNITPTQQAAFTAALIEESGGDMSKVATSYATAARSRRKVGKAIANTIKEQWTPPKLASLHWDSKLLPSLDNKYKHQERLTVAVGTQQDLKLLGVPSYEPGTDRKSGDIISEATVGLLESWNCKDSIVNMVFDTTASNTGHISAACIKIQESLQRSLLWSGCRHHIGEVILTHIFKDLAIEVSKSPDITVFSRFRKNFDLLPHNDDQVLSTLNLSSFSEEVQVMIKQWVDDLLHLLRSELKLKRDDYREFVELCLVFVGEEDTVKFKQPGAIHKARWMAKLLYSLKICLLETEIQKLPAGTITTKHQLPKLRDFANFVTLVYSSWWLSAGSAVDAPHNDLLLYKQILNYRAVNETVSDSALSAFTRHLWYLTAEMVPIALFSTKVSTEQRRALALSLLAAKPDSHVSSPENRFGTGFGKPKFPEHISELTELSDFVSKDSWFSMALLKIDDRFLEEPVESWTDSQAYHVSLTNVHSLNVINDCAERGVKLSSDFLSAARSEDHYQNVLQVVEEDRRSRPNLRKRKAKTDK